MSWNLNIFFFTVERNTYDFCVQGASHFDSRKWLNGVTECANALQGRDFLQFHEIMNSDDPEGPFIKDIRTEVEGRLIRKQTGRLHGFSTTDLAKMLTRGGRSRQSPKFCGHPLWMVLCWYQKMAMGLWRWLRMFSVFHLNCCTAHLNTICHTWKKDPEEGNK